MQVADITDGMYFRAEDTSGLRAIYDEINAMEKSQVEVQVFNQYTELAAFFLIPALIVLLVEMLDGEFGIDGRQVMSLEDLGILRSRSASGVRLSNSSKVSTSLLTSSSLIKLRMGAR